MHTKHSHLLKIRTAAALCVALFLCACNYERIPDDGGSEGPDGEMATVTLAVGTASGEHTLTTKGLSPDQENAINTLYILAFQKEDGSDNFSLKYYATGRPVSDGSGKFSFSLRRSVSGVADTKLLLVANHNPYPLVNTGMTYDQVQQALTIRELSEKPAFANTGIPMFGFAGGTSNKDPREPLLITDNMTLTANLLRAVARVDVGVGNYNDKNGVWDKGDAANFTLTEIYVFKPQTGYTLLPLINNLQYVEGIPSVTRPSPPSPLSPPSPAGEQSSSRWVYGTDIITNGTSCEAEIYLPEVYFAGGTVYDSNHDQRMALVIGGTYNAATNYYRIDFTTKQVNTKGDLLNDVLRNHLYRFSITKVSQVGYTTPEAAYSGKPVELNFKAEMVDWETGTTGMPEADMVVRMNFGGINGTVIKSSEMTENGTPQTFEISKKKDYFVTDDRLTKSPLNYNNMLGEAKDNIFNGVTNGGIYRSVKDALDREGPFGSLVIAPDNASMGVVWRSTGKDVPKKDRILNAKKACWDYRGQGRSDWRLPRLSELMLLWMNKATINISKGFTSLGDADETYWTGSEGLSDKAYAVNRYGEITLEAKTVSHMVRCVREVR